MGNCIRKESPMHWGGEDWGSPAPELLFSGKDPLRRNTRKNDTDVSPHFPSPAAASATKTTTEVKIKITKKQLAELLGKVEVQGMSVHQLLEQLATAGDRFQAEHRSWRPALQSIPEN